MLWHCSTCFSKRARLSPRPSMIRISGPVIFRNWRGPYSLGLAQLYQVLLALQAQAGWTPGMLPNNSKRTIPARAAHPSLTRCSTSVSRWQCMAQALAWTQASI